MSHEWLWPAAGVVAGISGVVVSHLASLKVKEREVAACEGMKHRAQRRLLFLALVLAGCHQPVNWTPDPPWDHVPLTVDYTAMGPVFDSSLSSALAAWNYAAGCKVVIDGRHGDQSRTTDKHAELQGIKLNRAPIDGVSGPPADVVVSPYDGTACGADANLEATGDATAGTWRCSPTHAEVHFRVMTDIRSVFVIAEHELGHVVGLAHDRSTLMQAAPPLDHPEDFAGRVGLMPLPSDADGAAVGKRYCR